MVYFSSNQKRQSAERKILREANVDEKNIRILLEGQEKRGDDVAIGLSLESNGLKKWRESYGQITQRIIAKSNKSRITHSIENCSTAIYWRPCLLCYCKL